mmetsp:Transcript_4655/g.9509  ORF Transcript_4655/g.9509 Transcript_4655/m.9509 type:complete len:505 (+) Transcript_4655:56-1570(+)
MNETTILLSPSPGDPNVTPDFLATVEPLTLLPRDPSVQSASSSSPKDDYFSSSSLTLPFEIVLDGYTREPWSSGAQPPYDTDSGDVNNPWKCGYLQSTDGRNRLPGFFQYLQSRKKAALAKFEPSPLDGTAFSNGSSVDAASGNFKALLVVPYDPPPIPDHLKLPDGVHSNQLIFVKYLGDERLIFKKKRDKSAEEQKRKMMQVQQLQQEQQKKMMMQQKQKQQMQIRQQKMMQQNSQQHNQQQQSSTKKGGLLGSLLGAQRRTENHLQMVRAKKTSSTDPLSSDPPATGAAGAISSFRTKISTQLQRFHDDPTSFVEKVCISLPDLVRGVPVEDREKVTMDVFKYVVHEQVEEVGMDRWVAAKEPGAFLDECVICVYKEGHCPKDILEEINKVGFWGRFLNFYFFLLAWFRLVRLFLTHMFGFVVANVVFVQYYIGCTYLTFHKIIPIITAKTISTTTQCYQQNKKIQNRGNYPTKSEDSNDTCKKRNPKPCNAKIRKKTKSL